MLNLPTLFKQNQIYQPYSCSLAYLKLILLTCATYTLMSTLFPSKPNIPPSATVNLHLLQSWYDKSMFVFVFPLFNYIYIIIVINIIIIIIMYIYIYIYIYYTDRFCIYIYIYIVLIHTYISRQAQFYLFFCDICSVKFN